MSWRRLATGLAIVAAAAALISVVRVLKTSGSSINDEVGAFNACIRQSRVLAITKHESGRTLVEMISDRADGGLVGEFAAFPSVRSEESFRAPIGPPSGNGAANGRLLVVTKGVTGRDANAIIRCETAPAFPPA
jgi:hypothetical protein